MKKSTIMMAIVVTFAMACSTNEEDNSTTESIVGKWEFNKVNYIINGYTSPENDYSNNQPGCARNFLEFKEDGNADSGSFTSECVMSINTEPWTLIDNVLHVESGSNSVPDSWQIIGITETELRLRGDISGIEGSEPGVEQFINLIFEKAAN